MKQEEQTNEDQNQGKWNQMVEMVKRAMGILPDDDIKKQEGPQDKFFVHVEDGVDVIVDSKNNVIDRQHPDHSRTPLKDKQHYDKPKKIRKAPDFSFKRARHNRGRGLTGTK